MRKALLSAFGGLALFIGNAAATPIAVFNDPYYCGNHANACGGDVIGDFEKFDIRRLTVMDLTKDKLKIKIEFNFGNNPNTAFDVFTVNKQLNVGDILFDVGNNGSWEYGAVLRGHTNAAGSTEATKGALKTGGFYNASGILTAQNVLNIANLTSYRPFEPVWIKQTSTLFTGATGTVAINGGGTATMTTTEYSTVYEASFANHDNPLFGKNFRIQFASATCGNDIVGGVVTPEPATMAGVGAALVALGLLRRRSL